MPPQLRVTDIDEDTGEPCAEKLLLPQFFAGAQALVDRLVHRVHRQGGAAQVEEGHAVELPLHGVGPDGVFLFRHAHPSFLTIRCSVAAF